MSISPPPPKHHKKNSPTRFFWKCSNISCQVGTFFGTLWCLGGGGEMLILFVPTRTCRGGVAVLCRSYIGRNLRHPRRSIFRLLIISKNKKNSEKNSISMRNALKNVRQKDSTKTRKIQQNPRYQCGLYSPMFARSDSRVHMERRPYHFIGVGVDPEGKLDSVGVRESPVAQSGRK
jgi:hypothetical protein